MSITHSGGPALRPNNGLLLLQCCAPYKTIRVAVTSFDQDLGWCLADDVYLSYTFYNTPCYSGDSATSCGVVQVADVADCPSPAAPRGSTPAATTGSSGSSGRFDAVIHHILNLIPETAGTLHCSQGAARTRRRPLAWSRRRLGFAQ